MRKFVIKTDVYFPFEKGFEQKIENIDKYFKL